MKLNTNIMALQTSTALSRVNRVFGKSSARLSSGVRLNSASDGGAESAISAKMSLRLSNVAKSTYNASDAMSLIQIAEGTLSEIRNRVHRIRELSVQAANDTLTDGERSKIQVEIDSFKEEITASAWLCEYNGIKLLAGEAGDIQSVDQNVRIMKISDTIDQGVYNFDIAILSPGVFDVNLGSGFIGTAVGTVDGNILTISDIDNRKIVLDLTYADAGTCELKIEKKGLLFQVGASKGMETKINIPRINSETLELEGILVNDALNSSDAILKCDSALDELSTISARLGAYINRFMYTVTNLETTELNLESSLSRIRDTDMAKEMIDYAKSQVLIQADISLLAQANQRPQQLLTLIQ